MSELDYTHALVGHYVTVTGQSADMVRVGLRLDYVGIAPGRYEIVVAKLRIPLQDGDALWLYGTAGETAASPRAVDTHHEHEFIGLYDVENDALATMLAFARLHHQRIATLDADHTFLLPEDSDLRSLGYTNAFLARVHLYPAFAALEHLHVGGRRVRVLAVLPLTHEEWSRKVNEGVAALFDRFRADGRDLLAIRRR